MADMDCESLLLDDIPEKYSEDSDYGDICNADEDALLADCDETDFVSSKAGSRIKFVEDNSVLEEQGPEDVLELGTHDVELDEEDGYHKRQSSVMTVSSTTPPEAETKLICNKQDERETRFKTERHISTTSKKYSNIPDSLDDVVVSNYSYNNRNQRTFRGKSRGYQHNNFQRKVPEAKTVLINPHFKGNPNIRNPKLNWDARQRLNQNYKNQVGHIHPLMQNNNQVPDVNWNNMQNLQLQQPPPIPQFQQFIPPQVPQQQMYHQPPVPVQQPQHSPQVPQQLLAAYQPPQQCFIQPLQDQFYSQPPPQFNHPSQFSHPVPQFQSSVPQFSSEPPPYSQPNPIRMMPYANPQYIVPPNQLMQPMDPYGQPVYNQQPIQNTNPPLLQLPPNHQGQFGEQNKLNNLYQTSNLNKRKVVNNGVLRKNKKRNQIFSNNLHEVRTVQIPDTTVKEDDEDEETKQYRKLIEEQKKIREQILQQKEARRRQSVQNEENIAAGPTPNQTQGTLITVQQQTVIPLQQKLPMTVPKPVLPVNRVVPKVVQRVQNAFNNTVRKVTPKIMKPPNQVKVINNEASVDKQHLSSFLANRKILAKDQSLLDTNIVLISNLANGTTSFKLRKMCVGIGDVKNLQMLPKERQATIQFNSVASAHAFYKKYQHTMLDLSMIQVTLKALG